MTSEEGRVPSVANSAAPRFAQAAGETPRKSEWRTIDSAPHACHVLATRFDDCEWIVAVVSSPPSHPFTHWMPLPPPPADAARKGAPLAPASDEGPGSTPNPSLQTQEPSNG